MKILQVYKTLYDVVSYIDDEGKEKTKSFLADDPLDDAERAEIINKIETNFKIKFDK